MGNIEHLNTRKAELAGELRANKAKISEYNVNKSRFSLPSLIEYFILAGNETNGHIFGGHQNSNRRI